MLKAFWFEKYVYMAVNALGPWWQQINDCHSFVTWVICLLERINSSEINFYTVWFYNIGRIAAVCLRITVPSRALVFRMG